MADMSDKFTDKELSRLERRIRRVYSKSWLELEQKILDHTEKLRSNYDKMIKKLEKGSITQEEFDAWYEEEMWKAYRLKTLQEQMNASIHNANKIACAIINNKTPTIYALNHNYSLYQLEKHFGYSFTIVNTNTVRRLLLEKDHVNFRVNNVDKKADYQWNTKRLNNELLAGILQGDSPTKMAKRFQKVMQSNMSSAIRNARTSVTSAQNGGRLDSYAKLAERGVNVQKEWVATKDKRTRDSHVRLHGERMPWNISFSNGCQYPADPDGDPAEVYNCRCTIVPFLPAYEDDEHDEEFYKWAKEKRGIDLWQK